MPLPPHAAFARTSCRTAVAAGWHGAGWVTVVLLVLVLAACGGGGGGGTGTGAAADSATPAAAAAAGATGAAATAGAASAPVAAAAPAATASDSASAAAAPVAASGPPTLTVRAWGTPAAGIGPVMLVRVDGTVVGSIEVKATTPADHTFDVPTLRAGSAVDVVFTNDDMVGSEDRNLYVGYLRANTGQVVLPTAPGTTFDAGRGAAAFDGVGVSPGSGALYESGALRLTWPAAPAADPLRQARLAAAQLLRQASFGPTDADIDAIASRGAAAWIDAQIALPAQPGQVAFVQAKFNQGPSYRPFGTAYDAQWPVQQFWAGTANTRDPLRKRVAFALHKLFMVSQTDSNLWEHSRAYANYLDNLERLAFGNYRALLEEMALSPAMGIYLSHLRNRKEDLSVGRLPDENFARELMQLFSIGLVELNLDGSPKLDPQGRPIETYGNADVMAMAKVFTGWGWGLPDNQLTEANFLWGGPTYTAAGDQRIDLQRMKAYPGQHSSAEKRLFAGKASAVTIPAGSDAATSLRTALDTLFKHPNVGPFVGRQLIQSLVTGHPSPAYVARVASVFNNNGQGVRGDLGAVVRAILLDPEARGAGDAGFGKLREPILRVAQWLRAFNARSVSGEYLMAWDLTPLAQMPLNAPSVFSYVRPGYVPPNTTFASAGKTQPEFQLVNETTTAEWINLAAAMSYDGLGWTGTARDVVPRWDTELALATAGNITGLLDRLNLLLLAGAMSDDLRTAILDAVAGVSGRDAASQLNRVRVAVLLYLASPEYLVQR